MYDIIEKHYRERRLKILKRLIFVTGSFENAEDVLQEAYTRSLKYIQSCREGEFDRWFSMILNNALMDFKREDRTGGQVEFEEEHEEGVACPSYANETMREIYELIDTKSTVQIEVLTLFMKHEYSAMDISKLLPYSYAQIHKIINRFQQELRDLYR